MKIISLLISCGVLLPSTVGAQYIVYDPTAHTQQVMDQAQNLAKYVEMVNNQVEQIQRLQSQLEELQQYNKAFGDPSKILKVTGAAGAILDLKKTPVGKTISDLQKIATGDEALIYTGNGVFDRIGNIFTTPSGNQVQRNPKEYRSNEAINRTTQNYTNVTSNVLQRRKALKDEIAATTQKLQSATTASEVQKLTGVLVGLNSALTATDKEIDQALAISLVQDIENRNDLERQLKARGEEQKAEFGESLQKYRETFHPLTGPPIFPTGGPNE